MNLVACSVLSFVVPVSGSPVSSALLPVSDDLPLPLPATNFASTRRLLATVSAVLVAGPSAPLVDPPEVARDQGSARSSPTEAVDLGEVYSSFVVYSLEEEEESHR